jgi:hypothetical protein
MKKEIRRSLGACAGAIAVFQIFGRFLPYSIFKLAPFGLSIIGGYLFSFFVGQTIANMSWSWFDPGDEDSKMADVTFFEVPKWMESLLALLAFGMWIVFSTAYRDRTVAELKNFGIHATATVLEVTNGSKTLDLTVQFSTQQGQLITTKGSVTDRETYKSLPNKEFVPIRYSSKNPDLIVLFPPTGAGEPVLNPQ